MYWSTDNTLHDSSRALEKSDVSLQIEKVGESRDAELVCHMVSLKDAVAHLGTSNPSGIKTIEK